VDAYQTAGTVPIGAAELGDHVAVAAGGHKQLRSATGASFLYLPRRWLPGLTPRRTGWWGHAEPFAFEKGPVRRADDATRLRSGTPTLTGMAMLLGELAALATSAEGSLPDAIRRARGVTRGLVARMLARAEALGLEPRGDYEADRRAAFVVFEVADSVRLAEALARDGIRVDVRPVRPGASDGYVRVGTNAAAFAYEVDAVLEAIAGHGPPR
jgi:kynureninase